MYIIYHTTYQLYHLQILYLVIKTIRCSYKHLLSLFLMAGIRTSLAIYTTYYINE